MCYDEQGIFYNAVGAVPAVVHQYNRFALLQQRIVARVSKAASAGTTAGMLKQITPDAIAATLLGVAGGSADTSAAGRPDVSREAGLLAEADRAAATGEDYLASVALTDLLELGPDRHAALQPRLFEHLQKLCETRGVRTDAPLGPPTRARVAPTRALLRSAPVG